MMSDIHRDCKWLGKTKVNGAFIHQTAGIIVKL